MYTLICVQLKKVIYLSCTKEVQTHIEILKYHRIKKGCYQHPFSSASNSNEFNTYKTYGKIK